MTKRGKARSSVLLVADGSAEARIERLLAQRPIEVSRCSGSRDAGTAGDVAAALIALPLDDESGAEILARARRDAPELPVLVTGADDSVPDPPTAFELGAADYVTDPVERPDELFFRLGLATGARKDDAQRFRQVQQAARDAALDRVVAQSEAMREVIEIARRLCSASAHPRPLPILLTGETGTGKNLIAQALHYNGARRSRPFVHVNCADLTPSLAASELFGHARGAFTDAKEAREGLFVQAHRGTLFLDEITELPLDVQATLLLAVEQRRVRPVGGAEDVDVDVQLVAATNANLAELVRRGRFRRDLYERVNGMPIHLPPLRERTEDISALADALVAELAAETAEPKRAVDDEARRLLEAHSWPSNVRELRNVLDRIVRLETDPIIRTEHVLETGRLRSASLVPGPGVEPRSVEVKQERPSGLHTRPGLGAAKPTPVVEAGGVRLRLPTGEAGISLDEVIAALLREAHRRYPDNLARAARWLGWSRDRYRSQLRVHQLAGDSVG